MKPVSRMRYPTFFIAGSLFVASLILYISTLAPSVVAIFADSLEFQLVTFQLGIAHPTGYPLYTLLGKLFTLMPFGNVAYRVNLMSAVFGAATVAVLYLLILQVAPPKKGLLLEKIGPPDPSDTSPEIPSWPTHLGAVVGALLLAVGPIFWQQATVAEVYALNAFFVALLLLLVTIIPALKGQTGLLVLAFLAGLALTHHRSILLLFPALALYLIFACDKSQLFKPKTILFGFLLFLVPLLLYLYLPLRGRVGSLDGTYLNTWAGFWRQVSGVGYGLFIFDNPFDAARSPTFYGNLLADQFYTAALGYVGILYLLLLGQRKMLALTGLAFVTYFAFNISYNVADIEVFFIPNFLILGIYTGVGAVFLLFAAAGIKLKKANGRAASVSKPVHQKSEEAEEAEPLAELGAERETLEAAPASTARSSPQPIAVETAPGFNIWKPILVIATLAIFALMIIQLFRTSLEIVGQSYTWQVHDYGLDMLQQPLPVASQGGSAIVGILGEITLIRYFQQTEHRRPDITTVAADLEADRIAVVENLLAQGKAVYLTRELPGAPERWSLSAVGPLIRVSPEPVTTLPDFSLTVTQPVIPEISLLGYSVSRPPHHDRGPAPVRLTLFWQLNSPVTTDLKVSARLLTPGGETQAIADAVPVHFAYPTSAWRPGEIISDVYDLALPVDTPSDSYTPLLIWYDPARNAAEVGRIRLEPVNVE